MWCELGRVQRGVAEQFESPPYSEWIAVSKMAASTGVSYLQLKEQLAETNDQFRGALGHFCLLFQDRDTEP